MEQTMGPSQDKLNQQLDQEKAEQEPSLDKMLDLDNPQVLKGLGELVEEIYQKRLAQERLDRGK
jgi:hypothetical protein